jgi:hypothetical protein
MHLYCRADNRFRNLRNWVAEIEDHRSPLVHGARHFDSGGFRAGSASLIAIVAAVVKGAVRSF